MADRTTPPATWPLSAATTLVLREPRAPSGDVLKLGLKELVLRGAWTVDRSTANRAFGRKRERLQLNPGGRPVPDLPPLRDLDARLQRVVDDDHRELSQVVKRLLKADGGLGDRLRDGARAELAGRGLLEVMRRPVLGVIPRTRVDRTPSGDVWARASWEREEALGTALAGGSVDSAVPAASLAALGGLVLLLDAGLLAGLDDALRRRRDGGGDAGHTQGSGEDGSSLEDAGALDLSSLGALDSIGSGFDAAVDAGGGEGGGSGDGGGDGGGGGGS